MALRPYEGGHFEKIGSEESHTIESYERHIHGTPFSEPQRQVSRQQFTERKTYGRDENGEVVVKIEKNPSEPVRPVSPVRPISPVGNHRDDHLLRPIQPLTIPRIELSSLSRNNSPRNSPRPRYAEDISPRSVTYQLDGRSPRSAPISPRSNASSGSQSDKMKKNGKDIWEALKSPDEAQAKVFQTFGKQCFALGVQGLLDEYQDEFREYKGANAVIEKTAFEANPAKNRCKDVTLRKATKDKATPDSQTIAFSMSFLKEIPAKHQATVSAVLQDADLPLETKLEILRTMKLEENVITKAADYLRPDFRLLLTDSRREVVNLLLKQEDWIVLKRVISGESTEIQASYTAFLEKVAENGGRVPADPSEPAEGPPSSTNRPKEAQNSGQKNQGNEANSKKKSRFFDGFPEETNILLLGRNGSGKAEFINSFPNYLKYENFDEALKNGPEVVIPTDSFSLVQDPNSRKMNYIPAEPQRTQFSRETQKTQMYSFMADGAQKYLRFIDTPDLPDREDVHGCIEKNKHLTSVLELVKNFGQIHAILIFLRSDEKDTFYYSKYANYLAAAFQQLHYQASKNICFCFTSIANTSYRPAEPAIKYVADWPFSFKDGHKVRVAENNTYCFENDSYRLLCAQQEGVPLSENAISGGRKHWTLSAQETFRLLGHIKTLTPFSNSTVYTILKLRPVLSDFFVSRIVQIVDADKEIQKLEKGSIQQGDKKEEDLRTLKERSDEFKRSFPKLVDFCVKMETCFQQNVLAYDDYLRDSLRKKVSTAEVKLDPSIIIMVRTYVEREKKHYAKEKETYMNYLQKSGSQIALEEIIAKELPAIEPYFAEESTEWRRILTEQQILTRPRSAKLITIKNDWYCNSHIWQ